MLHAHPPRASNECLVRAQATSRTRSKSNRQHSELDWSGIVHRRHNMPCVRHRQSVHCCVCSLRRIFGWRMHQILSLFGNLFPPSPSEVNEKTFLSLSKAGTMVSWIGTLVVAVCMVVVDNRLLGTIDRVRRVLLRVSKHDRICRRAHVWLFFFVCA